MNDGKRVCPVIKGRQLAAGDMTESQSSPGVTEGQVDRADEHVAELAAWGEAGGCTGFRHLRFGRSAACQGMGVIATAPLPTGTVVLTLPRRMAVTLQTCHSALPALEKHNVAEFSSFVMFLMQQRRALLAGCPGPFSAYLRALPEPETLTNALYLTDEDIAGLPEEYAAACRQTKDRAAASWAYISDFCDRHMAPEEAALFSDRPLRRWATAMVLSRAFQVRGRLVLLPVIDVCNNAADGCVLEYNEAADLTLRTRKAHAVGQEIFLCYGGKEGKPDPELLANYGYCSRDLGHQHPATGAHTP